MRPVDSCFFFSSLQFSAVYLLSNVGNGGRILSITIVRCMSFYGNTYRDEAPSPCHRICMTRKRCVDSQIFSSTAPTPPAAVLRYQDVVRLARVENRAEGLYNYIPIRCGRRDTRRSLRYPISLLASCLFSARCLTLFKSVSSTSCEDGWG